METAALRDSGSGNFEQLEEESMDEFEKGKIRFAIFTGKLGISLEAYAAVRQAECAGMERNESAVEGFCADGLRDVRHPFIDGTASEKELEERDRLCVGFMKLQQFTQESLRTNGIAAKQSAKASGVEPVDACGTEIRSVGVDTNPTALVETEKMGWLFQKFRNPERPAYIHEKGGFPVNGWNSCIRLWSWRDFRQEHLKRSAFLCRR